MDKCNPLTADGERIVKYDDWDSRHEAESKSINDKVAGSYERMKLAGKGSKTIKKLRKANKRRKRNQKHERRLKAARKAYLKLLCKGAKSKKTNPECNKEVMLQASARGALTKKQGMKSISLHACGRHSLRTLLHSLSLLPISHR